MLLDILDFLTWQVLGWNEVSVSIQVSEDIMNEVRILVLNVTNLKWLQNVHVLIRFNFAILKKGHWILDTLQTSSLQLHAPLPLMK